MQARQLRIEPTDHQIDAARDLLGRVPALSYDWTSAHGKAFLRYVDKLTEQGVPVAWIAEPLSLDAQRLYGVLARYRKANS